MTWEDKELLIKDICSRLPYNIKAMDHEDEPPFTIDSYDKSDFIDDDNWIDSDGWNHNITKTKPYLFPMSSITEEQRNDISKLLIDTQKEYSPFGKLNMNGCDNLFICTVKQANVLIDYCLTHHLDINGLIEKGLAVDATGLNIY